MSCRSFVWCLWCLAVLLLASQALRAATPANSAISNRALATFVDDASGAEVTVESNEVRSIVQPLEALTLTADNTSQALPGATVAFPHRLTNTGNVTSSYTLQVTNNGGDDYQLGNLSMVRDTNGNGQADAGEPVIAAGDTVTLAPDEFLNLVVIGTVPTTASPGQVARINVTATTAQGETESNTDTIRVLAERQVQVRKTASVASARPGDEVTFTLTITNLDAATPRGIPVVVDGATQTLIVLRDVVPANSVFIDFTDPGIGRALFHRVGDPVHTYSSQRPTNFSNVDAIAYGIATPPAELTLTLKVRVSEVASGALTNIAHLFFVDPTGAPQDIASNPAVVQLPQQAPAINFYTDESYANIAGSSLVGRPLFVQARVGQCNSDSTQIDRTFITITSRLTGDVETFEAVETGPNSGIFRIPVPVVTRAATPSVTRGDDVIETRSGDVLTAGIRCSENDPETLASTTIRLLDPSGIVFDMRTNTPIAGATVTLINVATGQPAQVFDVDGVTPAPGTVITGPDGTFTFPLVLPGQYRIVVVPPLTPIVYTVPLGPIPASQLPPGRVVVPGSFGLPFEVNAATGDVRFDVPLLPPPPTGLFAQKVASRRIVELTDVLDYQVQIRNTRDTALTGATLSDVLPTGFTYVQGSARLNGAALQNPSGGAGPSLTFNLGDIAASSTLTVAYRVRIGPGSRVGNNFNRAIASGTDNGLTVTSNTASALVRVQTGVFTDKGIIIGKVFVDRNRNSEQDKDEPGIPGVRVFVEDGTFAITDSEGKYSLYGLSARTHVIKVDRTTLPANAVLGPISNRHARSGATSFVDLKMGELHKVNFAEVTSSEAILEDVKARRAKADQVLSEQERNLQTELTRDEELEIGDVRSRPATGLIGNASGGENPDSGTWDVIPRNTNPANNTNSIIPPRPLTEGNSNLPAAPVRATPSERLEKLLPTLNNELGFIGLQDKDTLPTAQLSVRVKGVQGVTFKLKVNDEDVPASRVGVKSVLPSKQIEAWEYVGVRLKQGENTLEVSQIDSFGIERGTQKLTVIAPGVAGKLKVTLPKGTFPADTRTLVPVTVEIVDDRGALVSARTPVTLETLNGRWQVEDLDDVEPGVQTFIEKGRAEFQLLAPPEPGDSPIQVSSGALTSEATVAFVPELRPLIMGGVVEGKLSLRSLGRRGGVSDVFEDELRRLSGGDSALLSGRSAFFLKGRVGKDKLLTLRYESQRNNDDRLFRDIQPDRFYPIYGDSSIKGFDAQSNSRLYARLDKQKTYVLYGDFLTTDYSTSQGLGSYSRALTGLKYHHEMGRVAANFYASRDNARQVVEEFRANGTSGPFILRDVGYELQSEQIEIIVRDRNQPSVVLERTPLTRFLDYEIETLTGRILLRAPVPSLDSNFNPVFLRITYEIEQGGPRFWVRGFDGQVRLTNNLAVGGSWVSDRNPQDPFSLQSANFTLRLGSGTSLVGELARSNRLSLGRGSGQRLEFLHEQSRLQARLFWGDTDEAFDNPTSILSRGRKELSFKASYLLNQRTRLIGEAIRTQDASLGGHRKGFSAAVERALSDTLKLELGVRHAEESLIPSQTGSIGGTPVDFTSVRARLTGQVPKVPEASVGAEYEQDIQDSSRRVFALFGDYQFSSKGRIYARHEFISSLTGRYALNDNQEQHTTLVGIDTNYSKSGSVFSEYRIRDAISGREAEAAIGLRNKWSLGKGLQVNTALERIKSLSRTGLGLSTDGTALSVGVEYTTNPSFKGTSRLELRHGSDVNSVLHTLGLAYKVGNDFSLLGRSLINLSRGRSDAMPDSDHHRVQLGLAYRQTATDKWSALAKYEFRYDNDGDLLPVGSGLSQGLRRRLHILSADVNYQPQSRLVLTGHYATRLNADRSNGLSTSQGAHLLAGRVSYDLTQRTDISLVGSTLFGGGSRQYGLGLEAGYLIKRDLWLSVGYNLLGLNNDDLVGVENSRRGPFLRMRFKFDEDLLLNDSRAARRFAVADKQGTTKTQTTAPVVKNIKVVSEPVLDTALLKAQSVETPPQTKELRLAQRNGSKAKPRSTQPLAHLIASTPHIMMNPPVAPKTEQTAIALAKRVLNQPRPTLQVKLVVGGGTPTMNYEGRLMNVVNALHAEKSLHAQVIEPSRVSRVKSWLVSQHIVQERISTYAALAEANRVVARPDSEQLIQVSPQIWVRLLIPAAPIQQPSLARQVTQKQAQQATKSTKERPLSAPQGKPVAKVQKAGKNTARQSRIARKALRKSKLEAWMLK